MKQDPLEALMRLRRIAADKARRDLADCLRAESAAAEAVATIAASIEHEAEVATDLAAGDAEVEAFAAWLRRMRPTQRAAETAVEEATADTAEARAALAMARAAVRAVEEMQAHHADAARVAAERAAQRELDEVGRRGELIGSCPGQVVQWRHDD
jgi:flagellar export protein FliJ